MADIFTGGEVQEREKGSIHPSFWKKQVREAFGSDPYKLIIELIKNAADSYIRLKNSNKMQPPFNIFVEIDAPFKKLVPILTVKDNAEGMTKQELSTALEYATITSIMDKSSLTSAEKGVGLKDALMAMILFGNKDRIITIKNNKISIAEKDKNFMTNWIKKDASVSEEDRKESGIPENGTIIYGTLPSFFKDKKFNTIAEKLSKHFLLRKLLQIDDFKVHLIDGYTKQEEILTYKFPQKKSKLIDEDFYIEYKNEKYKAHIKIYEAEKNLEGKKPFGETGLLIYSGLYSVLDLSLGSYENDPRFANIFGEVYLDILNLEQKIRNGEEDPLVDNKRHGLITSNEFNLKLLQQINNYLEKIIQNKEEGETYTVNDNEILKYINKITKEISGSGSEYIPPITPKYFEFYPNYKEIKERSQETIDLIINAMEMKSDSVIKLKSTDPNFKISPQEI
ncbi:MAG: ATP-binding protein, partial [Minisyncoccia bacterium]